MLNLQHLRFLQKCIVAKNGADFEASLSCAEIRAEDCDKQQIADDQAFHIYPVFRRLSAAGPEKLVNFVFGVGLLQNLGEMLDKVFLRTQNESLLVFYCKTIPLVLSDGQQLEDS